MSSYYLLKSEPHEYSIEHLQRDYRSEWDGVRNYAARNFMREMEVNDRCFFYHSSTTKPAIVGTCRVIRAAQPDETALDESHENYDPKSTSESCRWDSVQVEFESQFETPITLQELRAQAKNNSTIAGMMLLQRGRLSVMPVTEAEWNAVLELQTRKERGNDLLLVQPDPPTTQTTTTTSKARDVDTPGFCSEADKTLSPAQIQAVVSGSAQALTEKELGLKGRKQLAVVDGGSRLVFFFDGKKMVGKDRERVTVMVQEAQKQYKNATPYVLLANDSNICKRKTFPELLNAGFIVQRVP